MLHATETGNKLQRRGPLARERLYLYLNVQLLGLEPGYKIIQSQQFLTKQINKLEYLLFSKNTVIG